MLQICSRRWSDHNSNGPERLIGEALSLESLIRGFSGLENLIRGNFGLEIGSELISVWKSDQKKFGSGPQPGFLILPVFLRRFHVHLTFGWVTQLRFWFQFKTNAFYDFDANCFQHTLSNFLVLTEFVVCIFVLSLDFIIEMSCLLR